MFATQPEAAVLDRIDDRLGRTLRGWKPAPSRRRRIRPGRRAGVIGLLAAAFLIGGATGNLRALYSVIAGPFGVPWQRGEALGLSQTVDGYRVTIDHAYADATRFALAMSVVDDRERGGTTQVAAMATVVTDAAGVKYDGFGAASSPDGPFAAANVVWKTPPELPLPAGPRKFHVVVPYIEIRDHSTPPPGADDSWTPWRSHPGPWTFDFVLDVDGGTTITPDTVAEVDGIELRVKRVIAAGGIVRVELALGGGLDPADYSPVGEVRRGGRILRFVAGTTEPDGTMVVLTDGGVTEPSGHWTIVVAELVGPGDSRPQGPWVLEFDVE